MTCLSKTSAVITSLLAGFAVDAFAGSASIRLRAWLPLGKAF